jgi:hypothetical protein
MRCLRGVELCLFGGLRGIGLAARGRLRSAVKRRSAAMGRRPFSGCRSAHAHKVLFFGAGFEARTRVEPQRSGAALNSRLSVAGGNAQRPRAPRCRERQMQQRFCLRAAGEAPAAKRPVLPPVLRLRASKMQAMRSLQPNHSIERTNNGGRLCAASAAVCAPLFAAHVER